MEVAYERWKLAWYGKETGRAEAFRESGNKKDTERKTDFGTGDWFFIQGGICQRTYDTGTACDGNGGE